MDVVNFPAILAQYGLLKPGDVITYDDLVLIGKKVNDKRNGSQYQELAMTIQDFLSMAGGGGSPVFCSITLAGDTAVYGPTVFFDHPNGSNDTVQDAITPAVSLTRYPSNPAPGNYGGCLYNTIIDPCCNGTTTPNNTEWFWVQAPYNPVDVATFTYQPLLDIVYNDWPCGGMVCAPGKVMIMHDTVTDRYFEITFVSWVSGGSGGFSWNRREIILTPGCGDGCIHFPDGSVLCSGNIQSGVPAIGQTLFVDPTTGNDATALPGRIDKMYATYAAALTAAASTDTIIMYPGTYTITTNMVKSGVSVFAHPGVVILGFGSTFSDRGFLSDTDTFSFKGYATIIGAGGGRVIDAQNIGDLTIEADSISSNGSATIWMQKIRGKVSVKSRILTNEVNSVIYAFGGTGSGSIVIDTEIFQVKTLSVFEMGMYLASGFAGNILLNAKKILINKTSSFRPGDLVCNQGTNPGSVKIIANEITSVNNNGSLILLQDQLNLYIKANVYTTQGLCIFSNSGNGLGTCELDFDKCTIDQEIALLGAGAWNTIIRGNYISNHTRASVLNGTGNINTRVFFGAGLTLNCLKPGGLLYSSTANGPRMIIDSATVITQGGAKSLEGVAGEKFTLNRYYASTGPISTIANLVAGSTIVIDPNVAL